MWVSHLSDMTPRYDSQIWFFELFQSDSNLRQAWVNGRHRPGSWWGGVGGQRLIRPFLENLNLDQWTYIRVCWDWVCWFSFSHSLFPKEPRLGAVIACGQGGSWPVLHVLCWAAASNFFAGSCVPCADRTTFPKLCQLCVGKGTEKCACSNHEPYFGYSGAFKWVRPAAVPWWPKCPVSSGWETLPGP